jgi:RNA-directed DNA polymerase
MSHLSALKSSSSIHDLAAILGFKASSISYLLYVIAPSARYNNFTIPKKTGGVRAIAAPIPELKLLQERLAEILQNCVDEINIINNRDDQIAHGFKRKKSIVTNAKQHRNRRYVFNLDLSNFFGTITFPRVRGFFISDRDFALHPKIATIIAQIACHQNSLPQGAPTSPVISNLIGHIMDVHLVRLASRNGCTYSRYADDLTFSTNKQDFPTSIAACISEDNDTWLPGSELTRLITRSHFEINESKTRMQYCDSRQEVTGLVVNRKVNVRSEYSRTVRAMLHNLFTKGSFDFIGSETTPSGAVSTTSTPGKIEELHGMLGFIDSIDLHNRTIQKSLKGQKDNLSSKESMYRHFLLFKDFYAAPKPVIICEGKTDNVYIVHAIRSLATHYPELATIDASGKIQLNVRIYRYTGTSTGRIIGINGGTGDFQNFTRQYKTDVQKFKAPGGPQPVILLVDNDSGSKGKGKLFNTVGSLIGKTVDGTEKFYHVSSNLYLVATPNPYGTAESMIEDFFDAATKATVIGGKTFDPINDVDTATSYSKHIFAQKVVRANADTINFNGFHPLLTNIVDVIKEHTK